MTREEIRQVVDVALQRVAPEADPARLKPHVNLRDQLDLDSMDFLNFVIGLHRALHVEIPEADYPKYVTLEGCVDHLASLLAAAPG